MINFGNVISFWNVGGLSQDRLKHKVFRLYIKNTPECLTMISKHEKAYEARGAKFRLGYKIFMLDLPTKMTRWLSDFLVRRVIQVNSNGFLSDKISTGFCPESIFLIYVNDLPNPHHRQNSKSQFADDTALWAASKMYNLQQNFCVRTYENWQSGVPNGE